MDEIIEQTMSELVNKLPPGTRVHMVVFAPNGVGKLGTNIISGLGVIVHDLHDGLKQAIEYAKREAETCPTQTPYVN